MDFMIGTMLRISCVFLKVNQNGDVLYEKIHNLDLNGAFIECLGRLVRTRDNGYAFIGFIYTNTSMRRDVYLMKMDSLWEIEWTQTYGNANVSDIALWGEQAPDGGYIMSGYSRVNDIADIYVIKTDSLGNEQWHQYMDEGNFERSNMIKPDPMGGGYIMGGFTGEPDGVATGFFDSADGFIVKLDDTGNELWRKWFTTPYYDYDVRVTPSNFGGYIVWQGEGYAGIPDSLPFQHNTELDKLNYIAYLDETGENEWWRTYFDPTDKTKQIRMVKQLEDGSLIVVGYANDPSKLDPLWGWMAKLSFTGEILWERTYYYYNLLNFVGQHPNEVTRNNYLTDVVQTPDGGFMATGTYRIYDDTTYIDKTNYAWLLKVDAMGCLEPGCNEDSVYVSVEDMPFIPLSGSPSVLMQLQPNPVKQGGVLGVGLSSAHFGGGVFRLYDLQGRQLAQRQVAVGEARFELPLSGFGAGILLCVLEDQQGRVLAQEKVVVLGK